VRSLRSFTVSDLHVAVYTDAQPTAERIELIRLHPFKVFRNRINSDTGAEGVAVGHPPQNLDRPAQVRSQGLTNVGQCVELARCCLSVAVPNRNEVVPVDRRRSGSDCARWTLGRVTLIAGDSILRSHPRTSHLKEIELGGNLKQGTGLRGQTMHSSNLAVDHCQFQPSCRTG
jgi:hypothetical protein